MAQHRPLPDRQVWAAQALVVLLALRQMLKVRGIMEIEATVPAEL
jgi:hypothetical protein